MRITGVTTIPQPHASPVIVSVLTCIVLAGPVHATSAVMPIKTKIIHCPKTNFTQACETNQRCCRLMKIDINIPVHPKKATPKPPAALPLYNYDRDGLTDLPIEDGLSVYIE